MGDNILADSDLPETKEDMTNSTQSNFNNSDNNTTSTSFSFSFTFDENNAESTDTINTAETTSNSSDTLASLELPHLTPNNTCYGIITKGERSLFGASLSRGDIVYILWDQSSHYELDVLRAIPELDSQGLCINWKKEDHIYRVRSNRVKLLEPDFSTNRSIIINPLNKVHDDDFMITFDNVFQQANQVTQYPHYVESPLNVDEGLESLIWPLQRSEFISRVFRKKCFFSLGSGQRLDTLRDDFQDFNVKNMIESSSRVVVWMKDAKTQKMQYIDANSDVGYNAYKSGHTLYFNPDLQTQEKYVKSLCLDLGYDFGIEKESGSFGGDLEIFAVNTKHSTPWHYDAQENFSIQLSGTKKWYFVPSDIVDPATNLHPSSTNRQSVRNDFAAHRATRSTFVKEQTQLDQETLLRSIVDLDNDPRVRSVVVRPGTVFYHPAGYWHKVVALDDEGSLSINFSLDTMRWGELFMSRIQQMILQETDFRSRISFTPFEQQNTNIAIEKARTHVQGMISNLTNLLQKITPEDIITPALFLENRPKKRLQADDLDRYRSGKKPVKNKSSRINEDENDGEGRGDDIETYTTSLSHITSYAMRNKIRESGSIREVDGYTLTGDGQNNGEQTTLGEDAVFYFHEAIEDCTTIVTRKQNIHDFDFMKNRFIVMNPLMSFTRYEPVKSFTPADAVQKTSTDTKCNTVLYNITSGFHIDNLTPHFQVKLAALRSKYEFNTIPETKYIFDAMILFLESLVETPATPHSPQKFTVLEIGSKIQHYYDMVSKKDSEDSNTEQSYNKSEVEKIIQVVTMDIILILNHIGYVNILN